MGGKLGKEGLRKETHYKHLEHGLEVIRPGYRTKGPGTYKGKQYPSHPVTHIMAQRAMAMVTFSTRDEGSEEGRARCGGE